MIPSIATVCISGNLLEKLEAIAKAGFSAVEIFENDLIAHPGSPAEVRRICEDLGLTIVTCQPFRDFEGMPEARRQRTFDLAERKFDLLAELGTDLLFVCSSLSPEAGGGLDRLADDFAALGERAARRGTKGTQTSEASPAIAVLRPMPRPETPMRSISMERRGMLSASPTPTSATSRMAAAIPKRCCAGSVAVTAPRG